MASKGLMRDSYIGGIGNASFIPDDTGYHPNHLLTKDERLTSKDGVIDRQPVSPAWDTFDIVKNGNQTDEDKIIRLTCSDDVKVTNINKTEEYNVGYVGLSILPWEDFAFNPRVFNELFYVETNNRITYDPDEVNTFFHGKNVMPPSVGDISENGKSWNIVVDNVPDLKKVRTWLTERCSVFGVTLLYKAKRFKKAERAPCLVMMDPNKGTIGDRLYTTITRAMDSLHTRRRFCVEIDLNGCVERWCRRVLMTDCKVVGGKLVITNGEEYLAMDETEDKICCVVCFPIWLLQTGIYKLHRTVVYDDFYVTFDADDLFLHGAFQDASCQRRQIFTADQENAVFRTRSAAQTDLKTLQELGSFKFVCVKRYDKAEGEEMYDDSYISRMAEHDTTTFGELVQKRRDKVLIKEKRLAEKEKKSKISESTNHCQEAVSENKGIDDSNGLDDNHSVNDRVKQVDSPQKQDAGSGVDESDEGDDLSLRIPEVASILCDNDDETYREVSDSNRNDATESLFSPGAHHDLVPKDDVLGFTASVREDVENSLNGVSRFNDDRECDSETQSEDSDQENAIEASSHTGKDALISEMLKIEKTLPAVRDNSFLNSKSPEGLKVEDGSGRKKSNKSKPGVKKALKDLMKTTKGKRDNLPSETDERFIEASNKEKKEPQLISCNADGLKSSVKLIPATDGAMVQSDDKNICFDHHENGKDLGVRMMEPVKPKECKNKSLVLERQLDGEVQKKTRKDTDQVMCFDPDQDDEIENTSVTNMIENCNKKENKTSQSRENGSNIPMANSLTSLDGSSTDGDDVEMIYQAPSQPVGANSTPLFLQADDDFDVIEKVNTVNEFSSRNGDVSLYFNDDNASTQTDDEKINHVSKSSKQGNGPNRNQMFQKTNKSSLRRNLMPTNTGANNKEITTPVAAKSLDVDMEVTDFDQDGMETKLAVVKSMDTGLTTKLNTGQGAKRKPKRAIERYSSDRKYLGASVPSRQAKKKQ